MLLSGYHTPVRNTYFTRRWLSQIQKYEVGLISLGVFCRFLSLQVGLEIL